MAATGSGTSDGMDSTVALAITPTYCDFRKASTLKITVMPSTMFEDSSYPSKALAVLSIALPLPRELEYGSCLPPAKVSLTSYVYSSLIPSQHFSSPHNTPFATARLPSILPQRNIQQR